MVEVKVDGSKIKGEEKDLLTASGNDYGASVGSDLGPSS